MANANLSATVRNETGKGAGRKLRASGNVPAVIYGHAREPQSLSINTRELEKLLTQIAAASTVIELSLDGRMSRALIREIQRHPFKKQIMHVDFQELVAGEKVTVACPITYVGTAAGVREGGVLDQILHQLQIEVDPANMPNHIDVDVTDVAIGHSLHVRDIPVPNGVVFLDDPDTTVCVVAASRAAVEQEATDAAASAAASAASAEPEVIRKVKADDDAK
jgi:large subunit ribosomal protein L25